MGILGNILRRKFSGVDRPSSVVQWYCWDLSGYDLDIHSCTECFAISDVKFTTLRADDAVHQVGGVTCD